VELLFLSFFFFFGGVPPVVAFVCFRSVTSRAGGHRGGRRGEGRDKAAVIQKRLPRAQAGAVRHVYAGDAMGSDVGSFLAVLNLFV
jgi:hypothetical protein